MMQKMMHRAVSVRLTDFCQKSKLLPQSFEKTAMICPTTTSMLPGLPRFLLSAALEVTVGVEPPLQQNAHTNRAHHEPMVGTRRWCGNHQTAQKLLRSKKEHMNMDDWGQRCSCEGAHTREWRFGRGGEE